MRKASHFLNYWTGCAGGATLDGIGSHPYSDLAQPASEIDHHRERFRPCPFMENIDETNLSAE